MLKLCLWNQANEMSDLAEAKAKELTDAATKAAEQVCPLCFCQHQNTTLKLIYKTRKSSQGQYKSVQLKNKATG